MPNIMLHDDEARQALGRGVAKMARAVRGTLGPRGMNAIIDRPIGTPIISRDGASIAAEIELEDPFENMGAQVLREVSKQTNVVAGDGTTTATVLADALVQDGLACLAKGANPVELVEGLELAVAEVITDLHSNSIPISDFGWAVFYKMRRGSSGESGGGSKQTPTLPTLQFMTSSSRF